MENLINFNRFCVLPLCVFLGRCLLDCNVIFQYGSNWTPEKPSGKKQQDLKSSIYTEAVHILWNLWWVTFLFS
jgi:hypothetical protein